MWWWCLVTQLCLTLSSVAHQAPLFLEFSRQEFGSELPFPPPGESSHPRDQTWLSCASCTVVGFFTTEHPGVPGMAFLTLREAILWSKKLKRSKGRQGQRKISQETKVLVPPCQGLHILIWYRSASSAGTEAPTQVEDGRTMLTFLTSFN